MGILEDILSELREIKAHLASGDTAPAPAKTKAEDTPKTKTKAAAPKGPSLEDVQNKIRAIVDADEDNTAKVKAELTKLGAKRAGDLEGEPAKLAKLMAALEAIDAPASADGDGDDDLL